MINGQKLKKNHNFCREIPLSRKCKEIVKKKKFLINSRK